MTNRTATIIAIGFLSVFVTVLFVLLDLGFFWSLMADGRLSLYRGSGGRYTYSNIRQLECKIFHPDKQYRKIGSDGWMSDVINGGYWCMSDEDIQEFRATRG